jgi:thioredoxin 1
MNRGRTYNLKFFVNIGLVSIAILFIVLLFVFKGSMNTLVSKQMKEQAGIGIQKNISSVIDSAYNYTKKKEGYKITFLEFGATGCISCRRMEMVMNEIRKIYPKLVKVKFINILLPENQEIMKYFGIAVIPTQVLLNSNGNEVFRHTGYYSTDDLEKEFLKLDL